MDWIRYTRRAANFLLLLKAFPENKVRKLKRKRNEKLKHDLCVSDGAAVWWLARLLCCAGIVWAVLSLLPTNLSHHSRDYGWWYKKYQKIISRGTCVHACVFFLFVFYYSSKADTAWSVCVCLFVTFDVKKMSNWIFAPTRNRLSCQYFMRNNGYSE